MSQTVTLARRYPLPNPLKLGRFLKAPELGPRPLFFSGGSALNATSRVLKRYTHNSIHFVTPYDSGGSSAVLRRAFDMPAIGDLRSRLMALADEALGGHPEVFRLFTHRFPKGGQPGRLDQELAAMIAGDHPLLLSIQDPMRRLIRHQLEFFYQARPEGFDLRGASIGNLILAGGYLNNHEQLDPIVFLFSKLVNVRGEVHTIVNDNYHLACRLADGRQVIGQHLMTGKEVAPLTSPIVELELSARADEWVPVNSVLHARKRQLIESADLICFPPGSFHSSLLANLLPQGVGRAVAAAGVPKVYIPNLGRDPEQVGLGLVARVERLLAMLRRDAGAQTPVSDLLNLVIVDTEHGDYGETVDVAALEALGVQVAQVPLVTPASAPLIDPKRLVEAVLSLT
ncbi:GAK system CofD-like protein [Motiliproteus sp. SC1-56]|uniref:GAK system CofD-like protein n=1 Tax=Motiliproteus sp. SC1-56 TaxID=2799565 RepID=UPI001A8DE332|nr:GAK system CofD-like protein [Motiliproteus sp. SC1-56]